MRRLGRVVSICVLPVFGCSFDSDGARSPGAALGDPDNEEEESPAASGDLPGTATSGGAPPAGDEGNGDGDGGTPTGGGDPTDDTRGDDGGGTESAGETGTDGGGGSDDDAGDTADDGKTDGCSEPFAELWWAEDASVTSPMDLFMATSAVGDPMVAASDEESEGTAMFTLDLPCAGEYYAWGLVWDITPGAYGGADPDSFFVSAGGPEHVWRYGCQTGGQTGALSWQPVQSLLDQPCDVSGLVFEVDEAGAYELEFRNREPGEGSGVAAIGALIISTDEDFDPYSLYEPYD